MATKQVLVIDDEDGVREIIKLCLEAVAGWEVLTATSGLEGLVMAEAERPDAILLDVMMPGLDGSTTFKKLRANPATKDIPVILLTAKVRASEQKQFANLDVAGVITKPFNPEELVGQIQRMLSWRN
ncbi:MAG: response regulator [Coleofasciculaceae cyanobacterium]